MFTYTMIDIVKILKKKFTLRITVVTLWKHSLFFNVKKLITIEEVPLIEL